VTGGADIRALAEAAREARARVAGKIRNTPLELSHRFSEATGARVWLKLENLQFTGSFKLRGALNKLLVLDAAALAAGCVAASSGNHGAAVARAMHELGVGGVIFVPEGAAKTKVDAIRAYGCEVRHVGTDGLDTETHARQYAADRGMTYISPYNDLAVAAGQGTCGLEILDDLPAPEALFVAVGGGGLLSGVGSVLRAACPGIRIVACQPENSAVMAHSVAAGRILDLASRPTLSDGTAGGIEARSLTFDWCRELADEFVLVSEAEIAAAVRRYVDWRDQPIEGAAGVAVAALLREARRFRGKDVVVVICGANIGADVLRSILD
jgi:threonine dehydratase